MTTWGQAKTASAPVSLLPAGTRTYTVDNAKAHVNEHTNRREIVFSVSSSEGSGEFNISLEPWKVGDDRYLEVFAKTAASLGYDPGKSDDAPVTVNDIPPFLQNYLPHLRGALVELYVKHVESKDKEGNTRYQDDGVTPYYNHRVYVNKLVAPAGGASPTGEVTAVVAAPDDDGIVW